MKHYKLFIILLCMTSIIVLSSSATYSYFTNQANTDVVSFTLGNVKVQTDNTSENKWRYIPIDFPNSDNDKNDLVNENNLESSLSFNKLRPGDAFEKIITVTNTGSLTSRMKVSKAAGFSNSVYSFNISAADEASKKMVVEAQDKTYVIENIKPNESFKLKLRLEVPAEITYEEIKNKNLKTKISNNPLELLDIVATQYNNPGWNE